MCISAKNCDHLQLPGGGGASWNEKTQSGGVSEKATDLKSEKPVSNQS